ncbi:MAG TPA: NBR1-Ig-like domain-containing protein [Pyrinomonadaceae bacterium]|nr:NBR1-Ig-like domain-containing protein [Pyrinomonadaceae bacterium]
MKKILSLIILTFVLSIVANAQGLDAEIKNSGIRILTVMQQCKEFPAKVTVKNTGTEKWTTSPRVFNLYPVITKSPDNSTERKGGFDVNSMTPITYISQDVDTSASYTFTYQFKAPKVVGTYTIEWKMAKSGVRFGTRAYEIVKVIENPHADSDCR